MQLSGPVQRNALTNAEGFYSFIELPVGEYKVVVAGVDTNKYTLICGQNPADALLTAGVDVAVDFGYEPRGALISGAVWNDADSSCNRQASEVGLDSVLVKLFIASGNIFLKDTLTNRDGDYAFLNVQPDSYIVRVDDESLLRDKYEHTCPTTNVASLAVGANEKRTDVNFGYKLKNGRVLGAIWIDNVKNCMIDEMERMIDGMTVVLRGDATYSAVSNERGEYSIKAPPGSYAIAPVDSLLLKEYSRACGIDSIVVPPDEDVMRSFGYQPRTSSISGWVWVDVDGNGEWNNGEPPFAGVGIGLVQYETPDFDAPGTAWNAITDSAGFFHFDDLDPGYYQITYSKESLPPGYVRSYPMDDVWNVTVEPARDYPKMNFAFHPLPGGISGFLWIDEDANCLRSDDEPPYPEASVYLFAADSDPPVDSTRTDVDGSFSFGALFPNLYHLKLHPGDLECYSIACFSYTDGMAIAAGDTVDDADIGLQPRPSKIQGLIWRDDRAAGEPDPNMGMPGVGVSLWRGNDSLKYTETDEKGRYSFQTEAGEYTVKVDMAALPQFQWTNGDSGVPQAKVTATFCDSVAADFGFQCLARITGTVWLDKNGNQRVDDNEKRFAGVAVFLIGADAATTALTNDAGVFYFDKTPPGEYSLKTDRANEEIAKRVATTDTVYHILAEPCAVYTQNFGFTDDIVAYNAFTPNGDGINDVFLFKMPDDFSGDVYELQVFDRNWRHIRTIAITEKSGGWDGADENGKPQASGAYFYILRKNGEITHKGMVTLLR